MNVFLLCVFALVPFHNASAHETEVMVCPDFAQILRFENAITSYQDPGPAPTPAPEAEPEPIPENQLEPEIVPERSVKPKQPIAESPQTAEPAPLEIPAEVPSGSILRDEKVQPASAEELIPAVQPIQVPIAAPIASNIPEVPPAVQPLPVPATAPIASTVPEVTSTGDPIRRPWGVLTFCVFLLLLSVSANVFLGWQLIEVRKAKLK